MDFLNSGTRLVTALPLHTSTNMSRIKLRITFFFFIRKVGMEGFKFKSVVSLGWSKGIHH